jgi:hypothetical protein
MYGIEHCEILKETRAREMRDAARSGKFRLMTSPVPTIPQCQLPVEHR